MTKRISAKYKIDRRLGCNLWGRPKSPYNKRNTKPGQHGAMALRKKQSDYGNQLFAKQKLKFYYGDLTEKQLLYCAHDVVHLHKIYKQLENILIREKRFELYKDTMKFIKIRVNLDLASFKDDIWSH